MTPHPVARYIPLLIAGDEQGLRDLSCVFERSDAGLLAAVRMYDDVERSVVVH